MENPIPPSIVKAVCAVQTTLEAVKKSQRNAHGGYNFASTDDIYAAITRKMGEVGLLCIALEESPPDIIKVEKKAGEFSQWMKVAYVFVLATEDATWTDPRSRRTLFLQITGPQTFQAAQSYAEKAYLRSLLKIPTGDMDLDSLPDGFEFNPVLKPKEKAPSPPPAPREVPAPNGHSNGTKFIGELDQALGKCESESDLSEVWTANLAQITALGTEREKADELYDVHMERVSREAVDALAS